MKSILLTGFMLALWLSGCSAPEEQNAQTDAQQKQLSTAADRPLERAKSVEKQVLDSAEQQKKQVDGL
ncbi:MAG: hypothetical protein ACXV7J_14110 [Methylomonas sp.]